MESKITVTQISPDIWQFNEANGMGPYVDAYLICGKERALVVDCLQTLPDLYDRVRELTSLPLEVAITHGHLDHAGVSLKKFAEQGCSVFMDLRDLAVLQDRLSGNDSDPAWFTDLPEGKVFDLGGYRLETVSVPGHSPGSLLFWDRENGLIFSGDTIGSGHFWMQIPTALPLVRFLPGLERLYEKTRNTGEIKIYPGHRNQSPVQLTGQYIKDVLDITRGLISGLLQGEPAVLDFHDMHMEYRHLGQGMMVDYCYNEHAIRGYDPASPEERRKDRFEEKEMKSGGVCLRYELFRPEVGAGEKVPLVVYLHGAGERGEETRLVLANSGATTFASEELQREHPCFVLAPQCPEGQSWNVENYLRLIADTVTVLTRTQPVDACRVYITGLSMGGMGTWAAITRYPFLYAAAMPICGGGDPFAVRAAKNVPVWAFHAEDDDVVPVTGRFPGLREENLVGTRQMVSSLRNAGNRQVRYTEYPTGFMTGKHLFPHGSWIPAYEDRDALEWLFSQTRVDKYDVEWVVPGVWHIEDYNHDSLYVVEGRDKALVIDTGLGGGDLMGLLHSLTHLPLELAVTHAHGDHMLHSDKFGKFYMSRKDAGVMEAGRKRLMPGNKSTEADILDIRDGDRIDLGGGVEIEVLEAGGHTPGSVVFVDRTHGFCFTGDALGVWMQVPGALCLSEYRENLMRLEEKLSRPGYAELGYLGGHRRQEGGCYPFGADYKPNSLERVRDMIALCGRVLNSEGGEKPCPFGFEEPAFQAEYKAASMVFCRSVMK